MNIRQVDFQVMTLGALLVYSLPGRFGTTGFLLIEEI